MARGLRAKRGRLCHRQVSSGDFPRDHPAPLRRTPQQGHFRARLHADTGLLLAQVLLVGCRGLGCYCMFRRPVPCFTIANIQINTVKRRSWCIASSVTCASSSVRLCFPATSTRLSSVKLSLVILVTAVFRFSRPPSAMLVFLGPPQAFRRCVALAVSPVATGGPECCGFVMLPESQNQWLIMRQPPADQAWHYEQWLHLTCARRKRRKDASPADSNSRRRN